MAGGFVFRLEALRRVRQRAFEARQRVVADRLRAMERERRILAAANQQIADQIARARDMQSGGRIDVRALRGNRTHTIFLQRRMAECSERIRQHETELERERGEMVKASVAVKVLDKLRERQEARYTETRRRREAADESELAVQMYRRRDARTAIGNA